MSWMVRFVFRVYQNQSAHGHGIRTLVLYFGLLLNTLSDAIFRNTLSLSNRPYFCQPRRFPRSLHSIWLITVALSFVRLFEVNIFL